MNTVLDSASPPKLRLGAAARATPLKDSDTEPAASDALLYAVSGADLIAERIDELSSPSADLRGSSVDAFSPYSDCVASSLANRLCNGESNRGGLLRRVTDEVRVVKGRSRAAMGVDGSGRARIATRRRQSLINAS